MGTVSCRRQDWHERATHPVSSEELDTGGVELDLHHFPGSLFGLLLAFPVVGLGKHGSFDDGAAPCGVFGNEEAVPVHPNVSFAFGVRDLHPAAHGLAHSGNLPLGLDGGLGVVTVSLAMLASGVICCERIGAPNLTEALDDGEGALGGAEADCGVGACDSQPRTPESTIDERATNRKRGLTMSAQSYTDLVGLPRAHA